MDVFFQKIQQELEEAHLNIKSFDLARPWGGFFVLDEEQAQEFADIYFDGFDVSQLKIAGKLSPKILLIEPNQRLSWQYHNRRAEIWKVVQGRAGVVRSDDDAEGNLEILETGDKIILKQGERHRLVGLDDWAVIAEIWQHTVADNPSNEEDIVRVQDDFGR